MINVPLLPAIASCDHKLVQLWQEAYQNFLASVYAIPDHSLEHLVYGFLNYRAIIVLKFNHGLGEPLSESHIKDDKVLHLGDLLHDIYFVIFRPLLHIFKNCLLNNFSHLHQLVFKKGS